MKKQNQDRIALARRNNLAGRIAAVVAAGRTPGAQLVAAWARASIRASSASTKTTATA